MLIRGGVIAVVLVAGGYPLSAHTVPTLVVEAEFNSARQSEIRVNIDPRLFLASQPTTLPPIEAAWWLEQDAAARARTGAAAIVYLEKSLGFRIGDVALRGDWRVTAIDSATSFPLSSESAEVHLLAERLQLLPAVPGEFKVNVSNDCAVGVMLMNSIEGKPERHPQALFPSESSRGFKVPEIKPTAPVKLSATLVEVSPVTEKQGRFNAIQLLWLLTLTAVLLFYLGLRRRT